MIWQARVDGSDKPVCVLLSAITFVSKDFGDYYIIRYNGGVWGAPVLVRLAPVGGCSRSRGSLHVSGKLPRSTPRAHV